MELSTPDSCSLSVGSFELGLELGGFAGRGGGFPGRRPEGLMFRVEASTSTLDPDFLAGVLLLGVGGAGSAFTNLFVI